MIVIEPSTANAAGATATDACVGSPEVTPSKMRGALHFLEQHPLGAVAGVAAAAAFIEVELAVGILAGLGATALFATQSGPEARQQVLARGKRVLARARTAMHTKQKSPTAAADVSTPPAI